MMPLNKIKPGDKRKVGEVNGGEKVKKFLYTLGCSKGEEITLISILAENPNSGKTTIYNAITGKMEYVGN